METLIDLVCLEKKYWLTVAIIAKRVTENTQHLSLYGRPGHPRECQHQTSLTDELCGHAAKFRQRQLPRKVFVRGRERYSSRCTCRQDRWRTPASCGSD